MKESMKSTDSSTDFQIKDGITADLEIDKKTGYITNMTFDLKNVMDMTSEEGEVTKFTIDIAFSKFNEVGTVTIDQKIIDSAVDGALQELMDYADDYIDAIELEVLFEDYTSYNGTDLEYSGPKPEKVDVAIVDDEVTDGIIVINGYTMEIKNGVVQTPRKNS